MPLGDIERRRAEIVLRDYCAEKTSPAVRHKLSIVYRMEGNDAFVAERRPDWRDATIIRDYDIAKLRFIVKDRKWRLFWRDRNLKWHLFKEAPPSADIGSFLPVIDRHPIFYG